MMRSGEIANSDVDALETIAEIAIGGAERLFVTFLVGVAALTDFNVEGRAHRLGGWGLLASVAADYTSPAGLVVGASGDLTIAAAGATVHWLLLDVRGLETVRLQAAGANTTLVGHYGLS